MKELKNTCIVLAIVSLLLLSLIGYITHEDNQKYPYGEYEMTYRVHYTNTHYKDYTVKHNRPIHVTSHRGTNQVIKYNEGTVFETNAPIEVIRYVSKKK